MKQLKITEFGPQIKLMRDKYRLTQKLISQTSGISVEVIDDIETGRKLHPDLNTIVRLSDALKQHTKNLQG